MKIALVSNTGWSLYNFRRNLMMSLEKEGHEIIAISPHDDYCSRLPVRHIPVEISRKGINPLGELQLKDGLVEIYVREMVDAVLHFTTKPNIWGTLAARKASRLTNLPIIAINNIAGLGIVFAKKGPVRWILENLYRYSQKRAYHVFFQNPDDLELFTSGGLVPARKTSLLPGSGVDLDRFTYKPMIDRTNPVFIMSARLLKEKGVLQYVETARQVKADYPASVFKLLGKVDPGNKTSVSQEELDSWVAEGIIEWIPWSDDVCSLLGESDCVVLPSFYREGTPRSLLEGMAIGRPLITTDSPGCRETVISGVNGYLVKPRSAESLENAVRHFIRLNMDEKKKLSQGSRRLAENKYDEKIVIERYIKVLSSVKAGKNEN